MANIEKHRKQPMEQTVDAGSIANPTCARGPDLIGRYLSHQQNDGRIHLAGREDRGAPIILRLEDLPATPQNLDRIRERVRSLNQLLADSGTPFRLRVV